MFRLIVKGDRAAAINAARDRGFNVCGAIDLSHGQAAVDIRDQGEGALDRIMSWFCDAPQHTPFPVGTLLFYSEHRVDTVAL